MLETADLGDLFFLRSLALASTILDSSFSLTRARGLPARYQAGSSSWIPPIKLPAVISTQPCSPGSSSLCSRTSKPAGQRWGIPHSNSSWSYHRRRTHGRHMGHRCPGTYSWFQLKKQSSTEKIKFFSSFKVQLKNSLIFICFRIN